jgi:hypothetical protein
VVKFSVIFESRFGTAYKQRFSTNFLINSALISGGIVLSCPAAAVKSLEMVWLLPVRSDSVSSARFQQEM